MLARKSVDPKGRWKMHRVLPESGQAVLFVVSDKTEEHEGEFIRKVLKKPARAPRFRLEISALVALASEGVSVVPIVDIYDDPKIPYYVMPYFESGDLRRFLDSSTGLRDLESVLDFMDELYALLCQVHECGFAHRDLKPENILLDDKGRLVLCDLGLVKCEDQEGGTETIEQIGSRHYTAPEALAGPKQVDNPHALDVYSYGKIAYEFATGQRLLGVELPKKDFDLSTIREEHESKILNALIENLVSHDPAVRMETWNRLASTIKQIRNLRSNQIDLHDPKMVETLIAQKLQGNQLAQKRKQVQIEREYREQLFNRIREALADSKAAHQARQASALYNDVINVRIGEFSGLNNYDLPSELSGSGPALIAEFYAPRRCQLSLGTNYHRAESAPTVHFVILLVGPGKDGGQWVRFRDWQSKSVSGAAVGDVLLIEQAAEAAQEMANEWYQWFVEEFKEED